MRSSRTSSATSSLRVAALGLLGALLPGAARAHGGLPISTQIVFRGETLLVPTQYWGIFVGSEAGPWRWICDEAINDYKLRSVFAASDGALYATNLTGLTVSRDGGCDWRPLGGPIAALEVDSVVADPLGADRLFVTTNQRDAQNVPQAQLWIAVGLAQNTPTWRSAYSQSGVFVRGLTVAPDGKGLHLLTFAPAAATPPQLVLSQDGGATFKPRSLGPLPPVNAGASAVLLQSDFGAGRAYLRLQDDLNQVLTLANTSDGTTSELLRLTTPIYTVTLDAARGRALITTAAGLYTYNTGNGGAPVKADGLGRSQCAEIHGGALYACSWNYFPDFAAVARSVDPLEGPPFQSAPRKLFQYADTKGVLECPADTSVARICPALWAQNAPLLGITPDLGGAPDLGPASDNAPGSCQAAPGRAAPPLPALGLLAALGLLLRFSSRRRAICSSLPGHDQTHTHP